VSDHARTITAARPSRPHDPACPRVRTIPMRDGTDVSARLYRATVHGKSGTV
jgi:hypothetical protein